MKRLLIGLMFLTACGQTEPPTVQEVKDNVEYFYMTSPQGVDLECMIYGSQSEWTNQSKSWFSIACWKLDKNLN